MLSGWLRSTSAPELSSVAPSALKMPPPSADALFPTTTVPVLRETLAGPAKAPLKMPPPNCAWLGLSVYGGLNLVDPIVVEAIETFADPPVLRLPIAPPSPCRARLPTRIDPVMVMLAGSAEAIWPMPPPNDFGPLTLLNGTVDPDPVRGLSPPASPVAIPPPAPAWFLVT